MSIPLTEDEIAAVVAVVRAKGDAIRRAELAAARAKVDVGEAVDAEIALVRTLAARYGFDPDRVTWHADTRMLVPMPQEAS